MRLRVGSGRDHAERQVAYGAGDSFLFALNQVAQNWPGQIYFRPYGEMNGHWNSYCAYDSSGRQRGPSHTTAMFRKAFARTYLLLMATFVRTHARVELLSYFNAKRGSIFDLASKPKSLAAYRALIPKLG